ncbi:replication-relaxation family protein [Nocardioides sp. KR10-350]|uniref:replication-relaxation family protein n=1 Tax=Nocardioides cheoyonin TaxID=3156615 RepID=UPI0032B4BC37
MRRVDVRWLRGRLGPRDLAVLRTLRTHRLATTQQLRRWHFVDGFTSDEASLRSCQRVLARLERHGLLARLSQRLGGARRGAESIVWQLATTGDRLLSVIDGDHRRRYVEPGRAFISHGVAVTELAVRLHEAVRAGQLEEVSLNSEPDNWCRFLGPYGRAEILKPDLSAITVAGEFENHWLLERDLGSEHGPAIARKAQVYQRYYATGAYQDEHGIFPSVLWVVDDEPRRAALERTIAHTSGLTPGVHRVVLLGDFTAAIIANHASEGVPP